MNKIIIAASLLFGTLGHAQDAITLKNGKVIWSKVERVQETAIEYKPYENLDGPDASIDKSEVFSVKFQNGTVEMFDGVVSELKTKAQLQSYLATQLSRHGFEKDQNGRKYTASFQGDYLRLDVLDEKGKTLRSLVCDFSKVYQFQNVSKRSDHLAFINIFVSVAQNEKQTKWDTEKLVVRVDHFMKGQSILEALKKYHALVKTAVP